MKIHLRDRNPALVEAWRSRFGNTPEVEISCGDLFEVEADAVLSPANSFGFMDGGVDAVIEQKLWVQETLQRHLFTWDMDEVLVGESVIVATNNEVYKFLVSAPTMRVPSLLTGTVNVYLAFKSALKSVKLFNDLNPAEPSIKTLLVPGMGTGVGRLDPQIAAEQMFQAYQRANSPVKRYGELAEAFGFNTALVHGVRMPEQRPVREG